jgi:acyl-CoA synthetase (AMP-forming)/AMP-acid ligase II
MPEAETLLRDSLLVGAPLHLMDGAAPTLIDNIARRAAELPEGLLQNIDADGAVRGLDFAQLWRRSDVLAARLRAAGVGPGFEALLIAQDILDFVPAFWAALRVGAVVVPFTGVAKSAEPAALAAVLARFERPAIVGETASAAGERLREICPGAPFVAVDAPVEAFEPAPDAEEAAFPCMIPTSGSTGAVKLARFSRSTLLHRYWSQSYAPLHRAQRLIGIFPFDSLTGLRAVFLNYIVYAQMSPALLAGRPHAILEHVQAMGATHIHMTNSMAARIVAGEDELPPGLDLSTLKMIGLGGEASTRATAIGLAALLQRLGARDALRAGYGATETGSLLAGADPSAAPLDETGSIILGGCADGVSLRVVDDEGRVLPQGEVGHVEAFAPDTLFSGYHGEPDLDCFTADGWWKSGDLGVIGEAGFSFRGRAKQVLVINGRKFSLADMEARLQAEAGAEGALHVFVARRPEETTDSFGIAFAYAGEDGKAGSAERIRAAAVRCYGVAPRFILGLAPGEMPLSGAGKIDRDALAERALALPDAAGEGAPHGDEKIETVLEDLWREALNWSGPLERDRRFDDCGGDSLRVVTLLMGVEQKLQRRIGLSAFFSEPTFERLLALALEAPKTGAATAPESFWPLPDALHRGLLYHVESWPGTRLTDDRLLLALNEARPDRVSESRPPLFAIFNVPQEFSQLAQALGEAQPLYAFRSAYEVGSRDEDQIQAMALRYARDIQAICPEGPFFLLGQCQGGDIAIAVAQHLQRRKRRIPLLIFAEWTPEDVFYADPALLLFGRDSIMNPRVAEPGREPDWTGAFPDHVLAEVDGAYGELYSEANVASIAGEIARHCRAALESAPRPSGESAPPLNVSAKALPTRLGPGASLGLAVTIRNDGIEPIGGARSGLWLGGCWLPSNATVSSPAERLPLPLIAPGESIRAICRVSAPATLGRYDFVLEIVEERRRGRRDCWPTPFRSPVKIVAARGLLRRLELWARRLASS